MRASLPPSPLPYGSPWPQINQPADGPEDRRELSTPHSAYCWLRSLGLDPSQGMSLTKRRDLFEYFVRAIA